MIKNQPTILITNDDGINSPGLRAAALALAGIGHVVITAPREQSSAAGRALFLSADGRIEKRQIEIEGLTFEGYAIGGSPAQTVIQALLEILPDKPDLVVSGINYGENVGNSITASGTVGAAIEAASMIGVPAIAVSLQLHESLWLSHDESIDFSTAAHFTAQFARWTLTHQLPSDVDVLKIDVPFEARPETPWRLTRVAPIRYWEPVVRRKNGWDGPARLDGRAKASPETAGPDSDVTALRFDRVVSVTPLSIDLSSRLDLKAFEKQIRGG